MEQAACGARRGAEWLQQLHCIRRISAVRALRLLQEEAASSPSLVCFSDRLCERSAGSGGDALLSQQHDIDPGALAAAAAAEEDDDESRGALGSVRLSAAAALPFLRWAQRGLLAAPLPGAVPL